MVPGSVYYTETKAASEIYVGVNPENVVRTDEMRIDRPEDGIRFVRKVNTESVQMKRIRGINDIEGAVYVCEKQDDYRMVLTTREAHNKTTLLRSTPWIPYHGMKLLYMLVKIFINSRARNLRLLNSDNIHAYLATHNVLAMSDKGMSDSDIERVYDDIYLNISRMCSGLDTYIDEFIGRFTNHMFHVSCNTDRMEVHMQMDYRAYLYLQSLKNDG